MSLNLGTILQGTASERGDHPAMVIGELSISYAELHRGAQGIAQGLLDLGLQPGDKVSVMQPNVPPTTIIKPCMLINNVKGPPVMMAPIMRANAKIIPITVERSKSVHLQQSLAEKKSEQHETLWRLAK